jgi:hypothetical protein
MERHSGLRTRFVEEQSCVCLAPDDRFDSDALSAERTPSPAKPSSQGRGVCTISSNNAILIFNAAKHDRSKRDRLATRFAIEFGITPKAVRDIWNLRTWVKTTKPFWSQVDETNFLRRELRRNTKRMPMKRSVAKRAPPQVQDIPTISIPRFQDSFCRTQEGPTYDVEITGYHGRSVSETSEPTMSIPHAPPMAIPQSPATIAAHSDLRNSRRVFDGEWIIHPSFIVQEFESVFLEWSNMNPTFTLGGL